MNIVKNPDPILKEKLPEFDFNNPVVDPVELEKSMIETMFAHNAIGLAANQIGIKTRVFVMGHKSLPDGAQAFFNPEIVANTTDLVEGEEGCLSFPNVYVKIKRPKAIKVRFQNSKGEEQVATFEGMECRCFLHEFDHLEGITYQDRTSTLKWAMAVKKSIKRKYK
jgi:peptide deformylase